LLVYRIITASLLIFFATVLLIYRDGFFFPALILLLHGGIFLEWLSLLNASRLEKIIGLLILVLFFILFINSYLFENFLLVLLSSSCIFWLVGAPVTTLIKYRTPKVMNLIIALVVCIASLAALFTAFLNGIPFLLSILVSVWIIDSGAYLFGKVFGQRKLNATISPNKTWEGVYGAFFLTFLYCLFMVQIEGTWQSLALEYTGVWWLIVLSIVSFFVAIFADLFESKLKRNSGKKDSGRILPGHGGFFDRFDATLSIAPLVVLFNILNKSI
tara:strand:- start:128 stop:943 length:816 start_codon:yes stop_codon:yes gene_type:complete